MGIDWGLLGLKPSHGTIAGAGQARSREREEG